MSHYTIDYGEGGPTFDKDERALADIIDYIGQERFDKVQEELIAYLVQGATEQHFRLALSFAGVRGYPVGAWFRRTEVLAHARGLLS